MSDHAEWFAGLGRSVGSQPELLLRGDSNEHELQWDLWIRIDGPFAARKAAEIACERARREIADLITTAPAAIEDHACREDVGP